MRRISRKTTPNASCFLAIRLGLEELAPVVAVEPLAEPRDDRSIDAVFSFPPPALQG
jgi:hypothetical protein